MSSDENQLIHAQIQTDAALTIARIEAAEHILIAYANLNGEFLGEGRSPMIEAAALFLQREFSAAPPHVVGKPTTKPKPSRKCSICKQLIVGNEAIIDEGTAFQRHAECR